MPGTFCCGAPWIAWNTTDISQHKSSNSFLSVLIKSWRILSIKFLWSVSWCNQTNIQLRSCLKDCLICVWNHSCSLTIKNISMWNAVEDILYSPTIISHSPSFSISFFICNLSTFTAWEASTVILFSFFTAFTSPFSFPSFELFFHSALFSEDEQYCGNALKKSHSKCPMSLHCHLPLYLKNMT